MLTTLVQHPFDCLILVHPHIQILETTFQQLQGLDYPSLNISKELSKVLLTVSVSERTRQSQKWLIDALLTFQQHPVLCTYPDLLFEPSLSLDPLALFRQAARSVPIIVLWPGEYSDNRLSYAIPEHYHYRTWNISPALLLQPLLKILRIPTS